MKTNGTNARNQHGTKNADASFVGSAVRTDSAAIASHSEPHANADPALRASPGAPGCLRAFSRPALSLSKGFTLVELLIVIGIIAVLAGLLVPMVTRSRKVAGIVLMKSNFATIEQALGYYKQDFGDIPRNGYAMTDPPNTTNAPDGYRPAPPRTDPTLAMALIGPGPANAATVYPNGDPDGADGPGFKTRMALVGTNTFAGYAAGSTVLTPATLTLGSPLPAALTVSSTQQPFTVISIGGPGSPDSSVPIISAGGSSVVLVRPLINAAYYNASTPVALLLPTGKTYDPYLKADQFKVAYVTAPLQPGTSYEIRSLPVLLDVWGGPILYFPSYNSYANRLTGNTPGKAVPGTGTLTAPVTAGPLFGSPSNTSTTFMYNTAIDPTNHYTVPSVFWSGPLGSWGVNAAGTPVSPFTASCDPGTPMSQGQIAAILFKLGDQNANNAIEPGENLISQLPFFLISAGPDGQFTDLYPGATSVPATGSPGSPGTWSATVTKADDVYSFDH